MDKEKELRKALIDARDALDQCRRDKTTHIQIRVIASEAITNANAVLARNAVFPKPKSRKKLYISGGACLVVGAVAWIIFKGQPIAENT